MCSKIAFVLACGFSPTLFFFYGGGAGGLVTFGGETVRTSPRSFGLGQAETAAE